MFPTKEKYDKLLEEAQQYPNIKLLYDGSCAHFTGQITRFVLSMAPYLEEFYKVVMVKPDDHADIIWVSSDKFRKSLLDRGVPIIIDDVYQPPDVLGSTREILTLNAVKLLLKNSTTTQFEIHNRELYNYSIHQTVIAESGITKNLPKKGQIFPQITEEDFKKVVTSWNYIVWPNFRHGYHQDHRSLRDYFLDLPIPRYPELYDVPQSGSFIKGNPRKYDIHFVGNVSDWDKTVPLIQCHRERAWEALQNCPGNNFLRPSNCLGWHEYWKTLRQSKIVVAPWGWEPVTIRDVEAILAGCVLIKPDTSFAITYPNLPYFRCKQDFSDLSEVVTMILDRWDRLEQYRLEAYQQLHDASDYMPKRVYSMIAKAIDQPR